ncbi:MAG: hypothetical protein ACR2QE_02135 [Acidimicrobiales bacterium]
MALPDLNRSARRHAVYSVVRTAVAWWLLLVPFLVIPLLIGAVSPGGAVLVLMAMVLAPVVILIAPLEWFGERILRHVDGEGATGRLANVAHEIAIATGEQMHDVVIFESAMPNVGALPTRSGVVVVATTGAVKLLRREELEALVGAQVAGMTDGWCRLATRAEIVWRAIKIVALVSIPFFLLNPFLLGQVVLLAFMHFGPRTVESYRDLCADVAAVEATRHPEALGSALRHLRPAALLAHELKLGSFFLPTSPFFVIGRRSLFSVSHGRAKKFTSADAIALDLALRADRAEALAAGRPAHEYTGREYKRRWATMKRTQTLTDEERDAARTLAERLGAKTADQTLEQPPGPNTAALAARAEAGEDLGVNHVLGAIWRDVQAAKAERDNSPVGRHRPPG